MSRRSLFAVGAIAAAAACFAGEAQADPPHLDLHAFTNWLKGAVPLGDVNHKYILDCPKVEDHRIGKSKCSPFALKITVGDNSTGFPGGIGKVVHDALFPDKPTFTFKVAFAAANTDLLGRGDYAKPSSIWYNVFFGYYEIDVPKQGWGRPFGYENAQTATGKRAVRHDDLLRIGKADWNHFSNQLYGVPLDVVRRQGLDTVDAKVVRLPPVTQKIIGSGEWDLVEMDGVPVVGPYRSKHDGQKYADTGHVMPAWQYVFGRYDEDDSHVRTSFQPVRMHGKFYMSFKEDKDEHGQEIYKTFMFGGTVNADYPDAAENDRFLGLQMQSLEHVIDRESGIGFAVSCTGHPAACDHKQANREVDRLKRVADEARDAADKAGKALKDAAESVKKKAEEVAAAAKKKLHDAEEAVKRAAEDAKKKAERAWKCLKNPHHC
jgi:hypothetical protein